MEVLTTQRVFTGKGSQTYTCTSEEKLKIAEYFIKTHFIKEESKLQK